MTFGSMLSAANLVHTSLKTIRRLQTSRSSNYPATVSVSIAVFLSMFARTISHANSCLNLNSGSFYTAADQSIDWETSRQYSSKNSNDKARGPAAIYFLRVLLSYLKEYFVSVSTVVNLIQKPCFERAERM